MFFNFFEKYLGFFLVLFIFLTIGVFIWVGQKQEEFISKHNCKLIGVETERLGISTSGNVMIIEGKRSYICDDGITYSF